MEIDNASSRVTFTRDFPHGCRNLTSSSSLGKRFHSYTRDYPLGCGPNYPKSPRFCLVKTFGGRDNHGSSGNSTTLRHSTVSMKSKPPLGPTIGRVSKGSDVRNLKSNLSGQLGMKRKSYVGPTSGGVSKGSDVRNLKTSLSSQLGVSGQMMVGSKPCVGPTSGGVSKRSDVRNHKSSLSRQLQMSGQVMVSPTSISSVREKVVEMLRIFRERCDEMVKRGGVKRVDFEANKELSREGKITLQPSLMFGSIPGVEIGDKFYYRIELRIVGLHRLPQGGIDSMEYGGERYATCIVANEGHLDKLSDSNVMSYIGEGGTLKPNETGVPPDQQLKSGNLALNNSRKSKRPVRVVRGLRYGAGNAKIVYVYDGLYEVSDVLKKKGPLGNMIFEFLLTRNPGQDPVQWRRIFV